MGALHVGVTMAATGVSQARSEASDLHSGDAVHHEDSKSQAPSLEASVDDLSLELGELDLTSENINLSGIEKDVESLADHDLLKAILDQGEGLRDSSRRRRREGVCHLLLISGGGAAEHLLGCPAGLDPREYGRRYEDELRQAELASIEDYVAEADSLKALYSEVSGREVGGACVASFCLLGLDKPVAGLFHQNAQQALVMRFPSPIRILGVARFWSAMECCRRWRACSPGL